MIFSWATIAFLLLSSLGHAQRNVTAKDCSDPFLRKHPVLMSGDFPSYQTSAQVAASFDSMIQQGQRLEYRGFKNPNDEYLLPVLPTNTHGLVNAQYWVPWPTKVISAILSHIDWTIGNGFAEFPFFSDMGHGHFYLPQEKIHLLPSPQLNALERWRLILNDPELMILYHVREKYDYRPWSAVPHGAPHATPQTEPEIDDPQISFWRLHRNIFASMNSSKNIQVIAGPGGEANTASRILGYGAVATVHFSMAKNGCIPFMYKNRINHLDFSLQGLSVKNIPYNPQSGPK